MTQTEEPFSLPSSLPEKTWKRILYGLVVTVLPILCFSMANFIKPDWQSGDLRDYVALVLSPEASVGFLILLTYSVVCYILLLISPLNYSKSVITRLGVYTGILLAFQYFVLILLWSGAQFLYFCLIWLVSLIAPSIFRWAFAKWGQRNIVILTAVLLLIAYMVAVQMMGEAFGPFFYVIMFFMASAPLWALLLAGRTAIWLYKNFDSLKWNLHTKAGIAAWLVAYTAAWRYDLLKMFELYAALPTYPPCYIATAAAKGHPRFVRSREVKFANGQAMRVNPQLQRLKLAELALRATLPNLHKFLRSIYDVVGCRLARRIQHPLLADVAYLLLKPFEWMSIFILGIFMPEADQMASKMYIGHQSK